MIEAVRHFENHSYNNHLVGTTIKLQITWPQADGGKDISIKVIFLPAIFYTAIIYLFILPISEMSFHRVAERISFASDSKRLGFFHFQLAAYYRD